VQDDVLPRHVLLQVLQHQLPLVGTREGPHLLRELAVDLDEAPVEDGGLGGEGRGERGDCFLLLGFYLLLLLGLGLLLLGVALLGVLRFLGLGGLLCLALLLLLLEFPGVGVLLLVLLLLALRHDFFYMR
jgi:hypothetical protein